MHELNEIERGQICQSAYDSFRSADGGLRHFPGLIKKIIKTSAWKRRTSRGRVIELDSFRDLILKKPLEGWYLDRKQVEAVLASDEEALTLFRAEMDGPLAEHRRPTKGDHKACGTSFKHGNNNYWQARIQRDCPEEIENIASGKKKIMDVRREQGWVPKSKRVTLCGDVDVDAERIIKAMGSEYIIEMCQRFID